MLCYLRRDKPKYGWISKKFHPNINNKYHPNIKKTNIIQISITKKSTIVVSRSCSVDVAAPLIETYIFFYWYLDDIFIDILDDIFYWHLDIFIDIWIFLLIFGWYLFVILMISFLNILMFLLIFVYFYWDLDDICLIFIGKLLSRCTAAWDLHPLHWREALLLYSRLFYYILLYESGHELIGQLSSYIIFARYLPDLKKNHLIFARTFF